MKTLVKQTKKLGLDFLVAATRLYACAPKLGIKQVKKVKKESEKNNLKKQATLAFN